MAKLSKWLRGNLKDNVKETLGETIEHLLKLKPPVKKNKRRALMSSLRDLMKKDEALRKEYESLDVWFTEKEKNLKTVDKENRATFKKARVIQYSISYGADSIQTQNSNNIAREHAVSTNIKELQEIDPLNGQKAKKEEVENLSSLRIPHKFSFPASKQGSYVEPILEHVEKALFRFVVKYQDYIPSNIVKEFAIKCNPPRNIDFSDADILCLLNFIIKHISLFIIPHSDKTLFHGEYKLKPLDVLKSFKIEARNHYAHGITQSEGKWNDEKLQRLSTLALELVDCLGDENAFESLLEIKRNLSSELAEQYALPLKRKHESDEDEFQEKKRRMTDEELGELMDFALDIINKLESESEEHLNQIVRLAVDKNEAFINIWRSLITRKDENVKIQKFISLMNVRFDMNLKNKIGTN
ncbi:hypothetical protein Glove_21g41 [Diversispora epigaea]|uniref:Uncharacterized protein n=1 Tax=Diversispora epigaea TaxID=1348612 RepID=A0A397JKG8_9GLOM|nr:hypothetical protein Glove_21g41 [Diversispora epigaea]